MMKKSFFSLILLTNYNAVVESFTHDFSSQVSWKNIKTARHSSKNTIEQNKAIVSAIIGAIYIELSLAP